MNEEEHEDEFRREMAKEIKRSLLGIEPKPKPKKTIVHDDEELYYGSYSSKL